MDGFVNWDAGWPKSTGDIDLTADKAAMSAIGSSRRLVAAVSPIFFTHFSWKVSFSVVSIVSNNDPNFTGRRTGSTARMTL